MVQAPSSASDSRFAMASSRLGASQNTRSPSFQMQGARLTPRALASGPSTGRILTSHPQWPTSLEPCRHVRESLQQAPRGAGTVEGGVQIPHPAGLSRPFGIQRRGRLGQGGERRSLGSGARRAPKLLGPNSARTSSLHSSTNALRSRPARPRSGATKRSTWTTTR